MASSKGPKKGSTARGGARRGRRRKTPQDNLELGTDKLYFKIGEVAEIVDVAAYVLRYWETEFPMLKPQKSRSRQRVYGRKDVETLLKIKHLLYERKFTIAGARQELEPGRSKVDAAAPAVGYRARQSMATVREHLTSLRGTLRDWENPPSKAADPAEFIRARGGVRALLSEREIGSALSYRPERAPAGLGGDQGPQAAESLGAGEPTTGSPAAPGPSPATPALSAAAPRPPAVHAEASE